MAFKDALKDITHMLGDPEVKNILGALGKNSSGGQGQVNENLTVPWGLSFEQGQALRGEAVQRDQYAAARAQAQKAADIEAQRVALEGRQIAESEKQGAHNRSMNQLSDVQEQTMADARQTAAFTHAETLQQGSITANKTLQDDQQTFAVEQTQASREWAKDPTNPEYMANMAQIAASRTSAAASWLNAKTNAAELELRKAAALGQSGPTAETIKAAQERVMTAAKMAVFNDPETGDPVYTSVADQKKIIDLGMVREYEIGSIPIEMLRNHVKPDQYARMTEYARAMASGDQTLIDAANAKRVAEFNEAEKEYAATVEKAAQLSQAAATPVKGAGGQPTKSAVEQLPQQAPTPVIDYLPPGQKPGATPGMRPVNVTPSAFELQQQSALDNSLTAEEKKQVQQGLAADFRGYNPR